jgi:hypothetical protein
VVAVRWDLSYTHLVCGGRNNPPAKTYRCRGTDPSIQMQDASGLVPRTAPTLGVKRRDKESPT